MTKKALQLGIAPFDGGQERMVCTGCRRENQWMCDNRQMLCASVESTSLWMDVESGERTAYLEKAMAKSRRWR